MKKHKFLLLILVCSIFLSFVCSCATSVQSINIAEDNYIIKVGEQVELRPTINNSANYNFIYTPSIDGIVTVEGGTVCGLNVGEVEIEISTNDVTATAIKVKIIVEKNVQPKKIVVEDYIKIVVETKYQIEYNVEPLDASQEVTFISSNKNIVSVDENGVITAHKVGDAKITIKSKENSNVFAKVDIEVALPDAEKIETLEEVTINYKDTYNLEYSILPSNAVQDVYFQSMDESIATVDSEGVITAIKPGTTKVIVISSVNNNVKSEVLVKVESIDATSIITANELNLNFGDIHQIEYEVFPKEAYQGVIFEVSDLDALEVNEDGLLTAKKIGQYEVTLCAIDGSNVETKVIVNITGEEDTVFSFGNDFNLNQTISIYQDFNPLDGIRVFDNIEGELTDKIVVNSSVDNTEYGKYVVTYELEDKGLYLERVIEVVWNYDVTFIGHAGSLFGAMNSEEAILYAATVLKYPAIEIDLKQTKDGVFVLSHDSEFAGYKLEDYTWEELKDVEVTVSRAPGISNLNSNNSFTAKLCTLDRYLEICKEYNITAVIELKTSAGISNWTEQNTPDKSRMPALIKQIEDAGMINNIIFLTGQYECLAWTRRNGYEFIPCQYLVSTCQEQLYLNRCIDYNLDISFNVRDGIVNSDEWIKKYKDAGIKIATYTFEQYASYDEVQKWIDKGVDFITTDWHDVSKLKLPLK